MILLIAIESVVTLPLSLLILGICIISLLFLVSLAGGLLLLLIFLKKQLFLKNFSLTFLFYFNDFHSDVHNFLFFFFLLNLSLVCFPFSRVEAVIINFRPFFLFFLIEVFSLLHFFYVLL